MSTFRFIFLFATTSISFLSLVFFTNFIIDPNGQYLNEFYFQENYLADKLIKYRNIALRPGSYNDRKFIEQYAIKSKYNPKLIVLGSSISQEISSSFVGAKLLNLSVSGGSIEDIIVLSMLALNQNHLKISNVLIGVDYKMLVQDSENIPRYCALKNNFPLVNKNLQINLDKDCVFQVKKMTKIFSVKLLKQSIGQLIKPLLFDTAGVEHNIDIKRLDNLDIVQNDGSLVFDLTHHDNLSIDDLNRSYISNDHVIDKSKLENLSILINYLNNEKITTTIYLAPISPSLWALDSKHYLSQNEKIIKNKLSTIPNTKITGSFNPGSLNCLLEEFHDNTHAKLDCIRKALIKK